MKQISAKHRWDLQTVRVSRLDSSKVRFGSAQRYEFRIGFGKSHVVVLFSDDVVSWRKFRKPRTHFASLVKELSSMAAVDTFTVEGPGGFSNTILVEPGRIRVSQAGCPDQVCVDQGFVSDGAVPIVCLPNKLIIQIVGGGDRLDAATG